MKSKGEIRIPAEVIVWQHELATAEALAAAGYIVEFLPISTRKDSKSPDIFVNRKHQVIDISALI